MSFKQIRLAAAGVSFVIAVLAIFLPGWLGLYAASLPWDCRVAGVVVAMVCGVIGADVAVRLHYEQFGLLIWVLLGCGMLGGLLLNLYFGMVHAASVAALWDSGWAGLTPGCVITGAVSLVVSLGLWLWEWVKSVFKFNVDAFSSEMEGGLLVSAIISVSVMVVWWLMVLGRWPPEFLLLFSRA